MLSAVLRRSGGGDAFTFLLMLLAVCSVLVYLYQMAKPFLEILSDRWQTRSRMAHPEER